MKKSALTSWLVGAAVYGLCALPGISSANEATVYFATGSNELDARSLGRLRDMVRRMVAGSKLALSAHTDPRGGKALNARLREERARVVQEALVAAGVPADQVAVSTAAEAADTVSIKDYWRQRRVAITYDDAEKAEESAEKPIAKSEGKTDPKTAEGKTDPKTAEGKTEPEGKSEGKSEGNAKVASTATKPSENPTDSSVNSNGKKLEKIRLIYWRQLNHALWIVAKEKGFFAEEGFDVTLDEVDDDARVLKKHLEIDNASNVGTTNTNALEKGQKKYMAGAICGFAAHEAMRDGEQVVDIGSMVMIAESLIMKKDLAAQIDKDIHGFKGHKIGDMDYGNGEHAFLYTNVLRNALSKIGIIEKKDYDVAIYKQWDKMYGDLLAGKVDMIKGLPPYDVEFVRKNPEYARVPFARFFPYIPCCRQLITRKQLKDNREKYVRLLRASIRAHEYVVTHPRESSEVIGKALRISASSVRASIMNTYINLTPDPMRKGIELYQRSNDSYTKTKTSTAEFVDTSLYRDALLGLANENKDNPATKGYYETMIQRFRQNN